MDLPNCGRLTVVAAVNERVENHKRRKILKEVGNNYIGNREVSGHRVEFIRDTGASISIVTTDLVQQEQMTGWNIAGLLVDRCLKQYPEAVVLVNTPHYRGWLKVACIDTALYDLIIGKHTN